MIIRNCIVYTIGPRSFAQVFMDALFPHGTTDGVESQKDKDGLCITVNGFGCIRCEARRELKTMGVKIPTCSSDTPQEKP